MSWLWAVASLMQVRAPDPQQNQSPGPTCVATQGQSLLQRRTDLASHHALAAWEHPTEEFRGGSSFAEGAKRDLNADARFLIQATFGPTRSSMAELGMSPSYQSWVANQMKLPMESFRARYRARVNPRLWVPVLPGMPRSRCAAGSRWHGMAFTLDDLGKLVSVRANQIFVNGIFRSNVDPSATPPTCEDRPWLSNKVYKACTRNLPCAWGDQNWTSQKYCQQSCYDSGRGYDGDDCSGGWGSARVVGKDFYVCSVLPTIGGLLTLRGNGSDCSNVTLMSNPAMWLTTARANQSTQTSLSFNVTQPGVLLLAQSSPSCNLSDFILYQGKYYRYDSRLQLLENTLESPSAGGPQVCFAVPRTFINEFSCRLQAPCGTSTNSTPPTALFQVCGSPGEVANDPKLGNQYRFDEFPIPPCSGDGCFDNKADNVASVGPQNQAPFNVWALRALNASDQLRQRVAWALAQIFVVSVVGTSEAPERYLNFYDIFLRNAFGNFRNILREITYSPLMGRYLTYAGNTAFDFRGTYPDENYAREIMQLFTIGLWQLYPNGTRILDAQGNPVPTYNNSHIMNFARVFTGLNLQANRPNIEEGGNYIDPMLMMAPWHDVYPKPDLDGGYLGDGYPLCADIPPRAFLMKGARYRFSGYAPDGLSDAWVLSTNSSLYAALCSPSGAGGACQFALSVNLTVNVQCQREECNVDAPNLVKVGAGFFEYMPPTCVHLFLYNGRVTTIGSSSGFASSASQSCENPDTLVAGTSCCAGCTDIPDSVMRQNNFTCASANVTYPKMYNQRCKTCPIWSESKFCQLSCWRGGVGYAGDNCSAGLYRETVLCGQQGQRVRYPTAAALCAGVGMQVCPTQTAGGTCGYSTSKVWLPTPCNLSVAVYPDGQVSLQVDSRTKANKVAVQWTGRFPTSATCPNRCTVADDACVCDAQVEVRAVFSGVPTAADLKAQLKLGAMRPDGPCSSCSGDVRAYSTSGAIDRDTVFEFGGRFFKNVASWVRVGGGVFRNPPVFMQRGSAQKASALAEVEALIDYLSQHPNTRVLLGYRLIQRFVTSNPSPAYIYDVGEAFRTGTFGNVTYSGTYGCMAATIAAVLLHPEARDPSQGSPTTGALREPIVKIMHFLRSMEYVDTTGRDTILSNLDSLIGQTPFRSPTVFNFYDFDYQPARFPVGAVGPEFQLFSAPLAIGFFNGMMSLIEGALNLCKNGFGVATPRCTDGGTVTLPPANSSNGTLSQLDLLLTGGRLSRASMDIVSQAYMAAADGLRVQAAQRAIVLTPEFNTLGSPLPDNARPAQVPSATATATPAAAARPYKAVVHLFLAGGADTWNLVVPIKCGLQDEYLSVRKQVALSPASVLEVRTPGQPCSSFGVHGALGFVKELYNNGSAAFVSNIGSLVQPLTKLQFNLGRTSMCRGLFSHLDQQRASQTLRCQNGGSGNPKGLGGRIGDALASGGQKFRTASFSTAGTSLWSQGANTTMDVVDPGVGARRLSSLASVQNVIGNITSRQHQNVYSEEYTQRLGESIRSSEALAKYLDSVTLKTIYTSKTPLQKQFFQVARLIAARGMRQAERDFFFVQIGGFDTHSDAGTVFGNNMADIDQALRSFVAELTAQGVFNNVVIVTASDFGRTLVPNGIGTDHAYAGQHLIVGGGLRGGRIFNMYPGSLLGGSAQDVGRGRLIPQYPWESMMLPIAQWMGVEPAQENLVFPNLPNFNRSAHIIARTDLFVS